MPRVTTPIHLNREFRADLAWWQLFIASWNGRSFLPTPSVYEMASDASGLWGRGAWFQDKWSKVPWGIATQTLAITVKELLPILVAELYGEVPSDQVMVRGAHLHNPSLTRSTTR